MYYSHNNIGINSLRYNVEPIDALSNVNDN